MSETSELHILIRFNLGPDAKCILFSQTLKDDEKSPAPDDDTLRRGGEVENDNAAASSSSSNLWQGQESQQEQGAYSMENIGYIYLRGFRVTHIVGENLPLT